MTKENLNNRNETKPDIVSWNIFKFDAIQFFLKKLLKYSNDFYNQNFSVLWEKWAQTMELKQNNIFSKGHIQI